MLCSDSALNTTNEISRQLPVTSKEIKKLKITVNIKSSNDLPVTVTYCQNPAGNGLFYSSSFCYVRRLDYTCISHTHAHTHITCIFKHLGSTLSSEVEFLHYSEK